MGTLTLRGERQSDAQTWSSECPDVKNLQMTVNYK